MGQGEIAGTPGVRRLFPGPAGLGQLSLEAWQSPLHFADAAPASPGVSATSNTPTVPPRREPAPSSHRSQRPPQSPSAADSRPTNWLPGAQGLRGSPFLSRLDLGISPRPRGRKTLLPVRPSARGGLWEGPQWAPSRVPDPARAEALFSLPGRHLPSAPSLQVDFPRGRGTPESGAPHREPRLWAQLYGSAEAGPVARCMPGRRRAGPRSHHGGGLGFPVVALGCPAYPCCSGLRRPSGQV